MKSFFFSDVEVKAAMRSFSFHFQMRYDVLVQENRILFLFWIWLCCVVFDIIQFSNVMMCTVCILWIDALQASPVHYDLFS